MSELTLADYYTVDHVMELTGLKRSRVSSLMVEYGAIKIGNKLHATKEQVEAIRNRPNQTFKLSMLEE